MRLRTLLQHAPLVGVGLLVSACGSTVNEPGGPIEPVPTIEQGIAGRVEWLEGNHMPSAGSGSTNAVRRRVRIHEATTSGAVTDANHGDSYGLVTDVTTPIVAETESDALGNYEVELAPGAYSVFAEDTGAWYCNHFTVDGQLCVVEVAADAVSTFAIYIDYAAAY